jgi:hypothetical protein
MFVYMIIKKQAHESHLINLGKKIMKGSTKKNVY